MTDLSVFSTNTLFDLEAMSNLHEGRATLGENMPVSVYRLFEYSMRQTLETALGEDIAIRLFRGAGKVAGLEFCRKMLDTTLPVNRFLTQLKDILREMRIGILRIESMDKDNAMLITMSEDLDCSGLPVIGKTVCNYDEGFLEGILEAYTGQGYCVIEIDCWAKGDRVCRFDAHPIARKTEISC